MSKARDIADLGSNDVLETSSTGLDVTGTVTADAADIAGTITADGLTVDTGGTAVVLNHSATGPTLRFNNLDQTVADGQQLARIEFSTDDGGSTTDEAYLQLTATGGGGAADFDIMVGDGTPVKRARFGVGGDVSFYEDTGTTAKMVWDASAESLNTSRLNITDNAMASVPPSGSTSIHLNIGEGVLGGNLNYGTMIGTLGSGKGFIQQQRFDGAATTYDLLLQPNGGNVGIGDTAPERKLHVNSGSTNECALFESTDTEVTLALKDSTGTAEIKSRNDFRFNTGGSERARLDSSGNLLVGKTSTGLVNKGAMSFSVGTSGYSGSLAINHSTSNVNGSGFINFARDQAYIGSINQVGTSGVSYNTTSDYRLKENVAPMDNASERVKALKPCRFNFIADPDSTVDGFLAHEAQEVVPEAVHGSKDAMRTEEYEVSPAVEATYDEDGNELTPAVEAVMGTREVPDYQGIDQSKLVPLLTKALQEALTRIEALENANGNS